MKTFSMTRNKLDSERPGHQGTNEEPLWPRPQRACPLSRLSGREKFLHRIHVSSTFREISFPYLKSRDSRWFCGQFLTASIWPGVDRPGKTPGGHFFFQESCCHVSGVELGKGNNNFKKKCVYSFNYCSYSAPSLLEAETARRRCSAPPALPAAQTCPEPCGWCRT